MSNHPAGKGKLIDNAIQLLTGDYVWSDDFNQVKPLLLAILLKRNSTSQMLAQILQRQ